MRFSSLHFKGDEPRMKGLKQITLDKKPLGCVVALVGKNGAGKSRILDLISNYGKNLIAEDIINNKIEYFPQTRISNFSEWEKLFEQALLDDKVRVNIINQINQTLINPYRDIISRNIKEIRVEDLTKVLESSIKTPFENLFSSGISDEFKSLLTKESIEYFKSLSDELNFDRYNSLISDDDEDRIENKDSYKKFEKFKYYVEKFLSKSVSSKANKLKARENFTSSILLNSQSLNVELLSPGEKILFAYGILFYLLDINSKNNLKESIIVIDEPENHLHPSAQIQVIEAIREIINEKGQLWISTHSLPLISSLNYDEIFLVRENKLISPNRYNPGNSIVELMDSETNSFRMREFLTSASSWSYVNFMIQCFMSPEAFLKLSKNDAQFSPLSELLKRDPYVSILDYGSGKGRLATGIRETKELKNIIQFNAFEPDDIFKEDLKKNTFIKEIYDYKNLPPRKSFDLVLLFNVLHEISPEDWIEVFNLIRNSLTENGLLIIVEDKLLPKGERINKYGYLILNEYQILDLFGLEHTLYDEINPLSKVDERITFSVIPKKYIYTKGDFILKAIKNLSKEVFGKMETMRNEADKAENRNTDLSIGRKYAHYSQLYINSQFALKNLPKELSSKGELLIHRDYENY